MASPNAFNPTRPLHPQTVEEKSERQKKIDEWLPINADRSAKWWYSAFHNITAMVGAGVLGLPYAIAQLGWGPGVTLLIISWIITLYTLWQMVEMHEMVPGKRFDRYHELGQYAFGEKLGLYIVVPQQVVVMLGGTIVYTVTGGASLQKFHDTVCPSCKKIRLTFFILIFGSAQFVLSHLPSFNSISSISFVAAVTSIGYSTVAWAASAHKGVQENVQYTNTSKTTTDLVFNLFNAIGAVAFAYAGHTVVLEIQATIPSTPEKPSKVAMWRGVIVAYILVAFCYWPVAIIGYWVFGNQVKDNVLISLEKPAWMIAMANLFVVFHVIGSYQVFAMPMFDMLQSVLVKKLNFKPTTSLRFIVRNVYVAFTVFVAITFPFFGSLLGFFGGFAVTPTTYFLPCMIWLKIYKPKRFSLSWFTNWICIVLGLCIIILAPIGALRNIILDAKNYKFYT
ncbi:lysine histidine transporter 1 [Lathyrus oleraceus]|uniref:Lysine histidine transporter 1 n=1 Tax=Pisum sativum TaxID=3888 RepID=A0A9D5BH30_PEA|nr:lysine histidine transporter 1-like [Pisum sativum]KAI5443412.1 Lysine histidine transporter 1 [Pisum sativum]